MASEIVPRMAIHLINGECVESDTCDLSNPALSSKALSEFKELLEDMAKMDSEKKWQINMGRPNGGWAVVPGSSVLWIELVGFGGDDA